MRVLFVANTLPPTDLSGVGEQVVQLTRGLREAGHEVLVLGRADGRSKLWFPLSVLGRLVLAWWGFRPDVVQFHESDGAIGVGVLRLLGLLVPRRRSTLVSLLQVSYVEERRAVRPIVVGGKLLARPTREETRFRRYRALPHVLLGRLAAALSDLVLAPSEKTAEELVRDYGASAVGVVPNAKAPVEEPPRDRSREEYLLFVGRLRIRKGLEVLLSALTELSREVCLPLVVVGDGERESELRIAVQALGLADRVRLLGRRDAAGVREALAGARALVVPSLYEGMPLVVLEAMEAGVPVVATAVSGIPEVVDEETGWLVPPADPHALAEVLAVVSAQPEEARRRGRAGRRRLDGRFRPTQAAAAWLAALEHSSRVERRRELSNWMMGAAVWSVGVLGALLIVALQISARTRVGVLTLPFLHFKGGYVAALLALFAHFWVTVYLALAPRWGEPGDAEGGDLPVRSAPGLAFGLAGLAATGVVLTFWLGGRAQGGEVSVAVHGAVGLATLGFQIAALWAQRLALSRHERRMRVLRYRLALR